MDIYIGPDKSPQEERREILTKKLVGILRHEGHENVTFYKPEGEVLIDLVPVAKVEVISSKVTNLLWCPTASAQFKLDKSKILGLFKVNPRARPAVAWSSS